MGQPATIGRQPTTLIGLLLIILLTACNLATTGDESAVSQDEPVIAGDNLADPTGQVSSEPPPATLTIEGREQEAGITGYCWQQADDTSLCADGIGFTTPRDPIPAGSTFLAQFEAGLDAPPGSVQLSVFPASQPVLTGPEGSDWLYWKSVPGEQFTLSPSNKPSIELNLESALYVFNMFVDWPDQGGVNYGFLVEVGDAEGRNITPFVDDQGLPLDEGTYRTRFEETLGEFQSSLMAGLPDSYAGLWVEQVPEYRIVIALAGGEREAIGPYLDGYEWAYYAEVVTVDHALDELLADRAIADETAESVQVPAVTTIDIVNNRVELHVEDPDLFLAGLDQAGTQLPASVVVLASETEG